MTDFLPTQDPGPAPTDVPLASWQSYSAYTTSTYEYTTTITKVAYDPAGITAPSVEVEAKVVHTTSTGYTVVNVPLLYTGPFPAPPLGTLFTTHGEVLRPTPSSHSISAVTPTPTAGSDGNSNKGSSPSQPIAASSPVATASARPNNSGSNSNNGGGQNAGTTTANAQGGSGNAGVQSSQQQQGSPSTPTASSGSDGQGGQSLGSGSASNSVATPAPQPTTRPLPSSAASANSILSNAAASASIESVSASNAAASASLASVSATNAAQSSSASAASVSAANAASSASALSASASLQSAASSSIASSPHPTSSTSTVAGSPLNLASHGLSGGQIAGIVLGSVFGLLLLLLLVGFLLARRRRNGAGSGAAAERGAAGGGVGRKLSDKWASGFSRTGGDYAALGAGAGLVGLAMGEAGARRADGLNSNEWEEDRLSGGDGSGFFVVGGKRAGGRQYTKGEGSSGGDDPFASKSDAAAAGGLAGFGAGLAAALTGRRKGRNSGKSMETDHQALPTSSREADLADEDERAFMSDEDADPNSEGRGLMSFGDVGNSSEMTQAGPSGWTQMPSRGGEGYSGWGSAAVLGAGAMSAARRGKSQDYGENDNTGQHSSHDESSWLAGEASGSSRAARRGQRSSTDRYLSSNSPARERPMQSYGNAASSSSPIGHDRIPSFSGTFGDVDGDLSNHPYDEEALLGTTGAAGIGLAALAAGHRDSGHSQIDSDYGHDESFSRFLSQDTPLLGPGAYETRDQQPARRSSAMYSQPNRLSTIRSVGEFGEKDSQAPSMGQSSTSGTGSGSARYGRGRNVPLYASSSAPSVNSPSQQLASILDDHHRESEEDASATGMGTVAGFLSGLMPNLGGWTRSEDTGGYPSDGGRGSIRPLAVGHERGQEKDTADAQSQRASVYYNGSRISHKQPSPTESGQSSASNSVPSHISRNEADEEHGRETLDDDAATGGYTASVSNQSQNVSSGNSRSDSRRSGQTMSTRFTRDIHSGSNTNSQANSGSHGSSRRNESSSGYSGSTGAASYNPSYLARQSTSSTRGVGASSGSSGLASRGGNTSSSSSRRTREDGSSSAASRSLGSDGRSSRATAGDGEDLSRVSFDPGLANLEEVSNEGGSLPSADYYPSESLGAAVRRRADQDQQQEQGRSVPPLLYPALTSTSVPPLSTQWRESPRVESVSERANAYLLRQGPSLYASLTQPPGPSTTSPRRPPRRSQPSPSEVRPQLGSI